MNSLFKSITSLAAALLLAYPAEAALVLFDNMNYGGSNQGSGVGDWVDGSNRLQYLGGTNLTFGGDADYTNSAANAGTGSLERNDNIDDRFFTRDYADGSTTGEVWISMLLNPTTAGANTNEIVGVSLNSTGGLTAAGDVLGVGFDGTDLRAAWRDISLSTTSFDGTGTVMASSTVLLVAKLNIGAGADSFSMWLFDSGDSFGLTEASLGSALLSSSSADFGSGLDHIQVGGIQGFRTTFDQIRISDLSGDNGLQEVLSGAAIPEPSAALLSSLGALLLLRRRRGHFTASPRSPSP